MALDNDDKSRAKFNKKFRKIAVNEVKKLTGKQKKLYDSIKDNQNIAAVPKGKATNTLINNEVRLREFDSETYKEVKKPLMVSSAKAKAKKMKKRRAEANEFRTDLDSPNATKGYSTKLNMKIPKRNPARRPAPKENAKSLITRKGS